MYLWRRFRKKQLCLYILSVVLFSCAWSFLTLLILVAQDQYVEDAGLDEHGKRTTEDSYIGHGVQVVVGHYNGKMPSMSQKYNLSEEQLNGNNYSPVEGAGENGRPVKIDDKDKDNMAFDLFSINQFNIMVSDMIALNRSLPDMRKKACREKAYPVASLPTTSVIIVYHNEAWSTLLRTVTSVINRSPPHLLKEVILVDDFSNRTFLGDPLDDYVATLRVPIKVLRAQQRVGLIRARLMGAEQAVGDVLTFLDSHCECTDGWLEPLLGRIHEDRKAVVCPVIDVINDNTFAYQKGIELFRGGFNWNLQFRWYSVPPAEVKKRIDHGDAPIASPTMAGGLFSIDRNYFEELGTYDHQMDIWGGENLEISFRIWMCGGRVEILPCSHVGHIFRKASPHDFPDNGSSKILNANLVRVAEVWMDDWKYLFYKTAPQAQSMVKSIDVSDRVELRKQLRCNDFAWYLDNVWPEHFMPKPGVFFGRIRNNRDTTKTCLTVVQIANSLSHTGRGRQVSVDPCVSNFHRLQIENAGTGKCVVSTPGQPGKRRHTLKLKQCTLGFDMWQLWILNEEGQIKSDEHQCLTGQKVGQQMFVQIKECGQYPSEFWDYSPTRRTFIHRDSGFCLDEPDNRSASDEAKVPTLKKCSRGAPKHQQWTLHKVAWRPDMKTDEI